jgi:hypothetical protein
MRKVVSVAIMFASIAAYAGNEFSRDLLAYNYHTRELSHTWYHDRFTRPACVAGYIGLASFLATSYVLHKLGWSHENMQDLLVTGGFVGTVSYVGALVPLVLLKFCWRWFVKNPEEDGLKQTLELLSARLKNSIANNQIMLEDLQYHCADIGGPIGSELIKYARILRSSQACARCGICDSSDFV